MGSGAEWEQGVRSPKGRGEVERGRGSQEKQLLAQICHGANIPADLSQPMGLLWLSAACGRRGFDSPMIFPCCVSSGEYEMCGPGKLAVLCEQGSLLMPVLENTCPTRMCRLEAGR